MLAFGATQLKPLAAFSILLATMNCFSTATSRIVPPFFPLSGCASTAVADTAMRHINPATVTIR